MTQDPAAAPAAYRSPLLSRHGAVPAEAPDAGVAGHYGDPLAEQRNLAGESTGRAAVVDLSHRGLVTVSGPDRLTWLDSLSSQMLRTLQPGQSSETLLLTLQGRIEYDARVVDDGERTWLIVESDQAADLAGWLDRMRFMLRVEVADVSADWAVIGSVMAVPELETRLTWKDPWPHVAPGGVAYTEAPEAGHAGHEWSWHEYVLPAAELETAVAALEAAGVPLAGIMAAEALRIAAWRPRWGTEVDDKTIPHELDLLRTAVHLEKGCYRGQETIARVHNLGRPPRRLVFLQLDGTQHTLPARGSDVLLGERPIGRLTSVAWHWEMGPVALALIKRSADTGTQLVIDDNGQRYDAAQETIVSPSAGQAVGRQTGFIRGPRTAGRAGSGGA